MEVHEYVKVWAGLGFRSGIGFGLYPKTHHTHLTCSSHVSHVPRMHLVCHMYLTCNLGANYVRVGHRVVLAREPRAIIGVCQRVDDAHEIERRPLHGAPDAIEAENICFLQSEGVPTECDIAQPLAVVLKEKARLATHRRSRKKRK